MDKQDKKDMFELGKAYLDLQRENQELKETLEKIADIPISFVIKNGGAEYLRRVREMVKKVLKGGKNLDG